GELQQGGRGGRRRDEMTLSDLVLRDAMLRMAPQDEVAATLRSSFDVATNTVLILRRSRSGRLEGWPRSACACRNRDMPRGLTARDQQKWVPVLRPGARQLETAAHGPGTAFRL